MPRKKGRLSQKQLASEADIQLRDNAPEVLSKFWNAVKLGLDSGDRKTMEMVGRMFQYDKGPGGVTIFNQHLQVNGATQANESNARVKSFDQIIGKLEEQDNQNRAGRLLLDAATMENSDEDEEDDDDEIQDAEVEEIEPVAAEA